MSIGDEIEFPGRDIPCEGDNALMFYARQAGKHRKIFNLVATGHDVHARDELERTPLILATVSADVRNVVALLRGGADIKDRDSGGDTPLHWAVYHKNAPAVRLLLKKGADVAHRNDKGMTPLCVALELNDPVLLETFDRFRNEQVTAAFIKGTAGAIAVRAPLSFKPHIKGNKPRKPL